METSPLGNTANLISANDDLAPLRRITFVVYLLQALAFFSGVTYLAAVVINYVKRDEVKGTWLESHFRWQMRTFWWSIFWGTIGGLLALVVVGWAILPAVAVWVIYRIVKGWLRFNDGRPMYS